MPIVLGVDLGTTKITSIAVDTSAATIVAIASAVNEANITSAENRAIGHSEWQADLILATANQCLASVSAQLGSRVDNVVGLGITGQQHGMVLVDSTSLKLLSPLINWQDRRALQRMPNRDSTWLEAARAAVGADAWKQTGCWLHPGFMAVTLFELATRAQDQILGRDSIFFALEQAVLSAAHIKYGESQAVEAHIDRESGRHSLTVNGVGLDEQELGDLLSGISAQTAKQAVLERIRETHVISRKDTRALFIMDFFASALTGRPPVTEPSCAGSSGVLDVRTRRWNEEAIRSLRLPRFLFPPISEAGHVVGELTCEQAKSTGLPEGIPVFAPIGDHQASFLGSIADRRNSVLVNVGTGAQVAVYTDDFDFVAPIELRPFPFGGNLLSNVGLAGGWSYQVLEQFFHDVGRQFFQSESQEKLYEAMNQVAATIAPGADGLLCEPRFSGTRLDPTVRGTITGLSPQNFTAGHFARAILEGMGRSLHDGFKAIQAVTGQSPTTLIAAGNGLRENSLLAEIVAQAFGLSMKFTQHREEAAYGAALVASVGAKVFDNVDEASMHLIQTH